MKPTLKNSTGARLKNGSLIQRAAPFTSATKDLGKKPIASIKIPIIAKSDMHTGVRHLSGLARETIHITAMQAIPTAHWR